MSPTPQDRAWRRKWGGIFICSWLMLSLIAGGVGYLLIQSSQNQVASAFNPLVCITRQYIQASRARADFTAKHAPTATTRATAEQAVKSSDVFLAHLITLPRKHHCPTT